MDKRDIMQKNRLRDLIRLIKVAKNWYDPLLYHLGIKNQVILRFRNGLLFRYVPALFAIGMFLEEPYKKVNVRNRDVIDIGAFNGDSAIYFAYRGARTIRAFEPFPFAYSIAEENVRLNRLKNISIYNQGASDHESEFLVDRNFISNTGSKLTNSTQGIPIRVRSLKSIVEEFRLNEAILKIDCEGCEFEVVKSSDPRTLLAFCEIIIEYHHDPTEIISKLQTIGFDVLIMADSESPKSRQGLLFAKKK